MNRGISFSCASVHPGPRLAKRKIWAFLLLLKKEANGRERSTFPLYLERANRVEVADKQAEVRTIHRAVEVEVCGRVVAAAG